MSKKITLDDVLKSGQKVKVTRTVTFVYEVDMSEWMDGDNSDITVEEFQENIKDNQDIQTLLDQWGEDVETTFDEPEVTEIR
jgi:hypothetical protein